MCAHCRGRRAQRFRRARSPVTPSRRRACLPTRASTRFFWKTCTMRPTCCARSEPRPSRRSRGWRAKCAPRSISRWACRSWRARTVRRSELRWRRSARSFAPRALCSRASPTKVCSRRLMLARCCVTVARWAQRRRESRSSAISRKSTQPTRSPPTRLWLNTRMLQSFSDRTAWW